MTWASFACALILAAVPLLIGRLALAERHLNLTLSAAGGVAVAYVFIHILPDLGHAQDVIATQNLGRLGYLDKHAYILALAGLVIFYGLEAGIRHPAVRDSSRAFQAQIAIFAADNVLIGYLLLHQFQEDALALATFTFALALHFLTSFYAIRRDHPRDYDTSGRYYLAGGILIGWAIGVSTEFSETATSLVFAFLAGAIIFNALKEEIPAANHIRFGAFALAAALYAIVLLAT